MYTRCTKTGWKDIWSRDEGPDGWSGVECCCLREQEKRALLQFLWIRKRPVIGPLRYSIYRSWRRQVNATVERLKFSHGHSLSCLTTTPIKTDPLHLNALLLETAFGIIILSYTRPCPMCRRLPSVHAHNFRRSISYLRPLKRPLAQ